MSEQEIDRTRLPLGRPPSRGDDGVIVAEAPRLGGFSVDQKDVMVAAYLFEDLAKRNFDAVVKLAEDKAITVEGIIRVQKDADGEEHVSAIGDHLGRKGLKIGAAPGS